MSESVQAVSALMMIIGMIGSLIVWMDDRVYWPTRIGFPAATLLALGFLVWSILRRDKLPDFLSRVARRFLERDGFCFTVVARSVKGICYLDVSFQSRYDRPSRAQVVLQPSRGFFLTRPDLSSLTVGIECPGAGYGVTRIPWAVPADLQGKAQRIDVAANVSYPEGRGKMVRYRGGAQVGAAKIDVWKVALHAAAALGGMIVLTKPAQMKLALPGNVAETVPGDAPIVTEILWKLGDSTAVAPAPA